MAQTKRKRIALVAHDNRKSDMVEWVRWNYKLLLNHQLICTGTTGRLVEEAIKQRIEEDYLQAERRRQSPRIIKLKSGPFGGDQQLGAMIAEGRIDLLIFLWDP